jgi:hypothetical protein
MVLQRNFSIDEILSTSWVSKLATDLATEIETCTGEKPATLEEVRCFLAVKGFRELFRRLQEARAGRAGHEALKAVAHAMRGYALERPGLSAAAFRTPMANSQEWCEIYAQLRDFMMTIFAECGLGGAAAETALHILRSLVRGFVLHEIMNSFLCTHSYEDSFEAAIQVFSAGLPALASRGMV